MSREKEIIEAGIAYTIRTKPRMLGGDKFSEEMRKFNRNKEFEEIAKWADKTMIDKACEWLEEKLYEHTNMGEFVGTLSRYVYKQDTINQFRKAMEE